MSKPIYVLNGPNLNLLGQREPEIYGSDTLDDIRANLEDQAQKAGITIDFRQSNLEGELVQWIQEAREKGSGIIINAGAYSHTSIAIHDALKMVDIPIVEVHLSNLFKREAFRHHSHISALAVGLISGFGAQGYGFALEALTSRINKDG